ncbi:MAG: hypothetical protein GF353_17445 [Candidatus Lokiarchaeota archaeon]|nr:hypothetical protein [Candidatus Lokiarchaeota archaeon]
MRDTNYTVYDLILIGSMIGFFSIFFYYLSPSFGNWWNLSWERSNGQFDININAFGYNKNIQVLKSFSLYSGLIYTIGVSLALISSIKRRIVLSLFSVLLMLSGLTSFLIILFNSRFIYNAIVENTETHIKKASLFCGRKGELSWGLGIGFYLAVISTILISIAIIIKFSLSLVEKKRSSISKSIN